VPIQLIAGRFAVDDSKFRPGGMGRIYRATDLEEQKGCAFKVLGGSKQGSKLHELALTRELESLSRLSHPNVVRLIAHGTCDEFGMYVVFEWLEEDFDSRKARSLWHSFSSYYSDVGSTILEALCYAYTKGITHRDLKPSNIMFDLEGRPKLVDFGISGVLDRISIGATLRHLKSPIYSPPEEQAPDPVRDVYGFAAIAAFAISKTPPNSREDLLAAVATIPDEQERGVLESCLAVDCEDRPGSVLEVRQQLRGIFEGDTDDVRTLAYLRLPGNVEAILRERGLPCAIDQICSCLSTSSFLEPPKVRADGDPSRMVVVSAEMTVVIARDSANPGILVVISGAETRASHWSFAQEHSLPLPVEFRPANRLGRIQGADRVIDGIIEELQTHKALEDLASDESIFDTWRTILRGRVDYYGAKYPALIVKAFKSEGNRIFANLQEPPDQNIAGLSYFVEDGVNKIAVGVVEAVQDESVVLYCSALFDKSALDSGGRLRFNSAGTEIAIRKQEEALDRVQMGECPNGRLATYFSEPEKAPLPVTQPLQGIIKGLDQDKLNAVSGSLAASSVYLVVGPPGTGKTEFISELVLQELKNKPGARLLIAAQTHMAVDNALSRLRSIDPSVICVRLGRTSERISAESADIVLDKVAERWGAEVVARSKAALEEFGLERGVQVDRVRASRATRRAFSAQNQLNLLKDQVRAASDGAATLREIPIGSRTKADSRTIDHLEGKVLELRGEIQIADLRLREAEGEVFALGQAAVAELEGLKNADLDLSTMEGTVDGVMTIVAEWHRRVANPQDLFPAILADAQVVGGTCLGFIGVPGTSTIEYDTAIVEEASRALAPELMVPASRAKKVVLVGDGKQLPPFLESDLLGQGWLTANGLSRAEVEETLFDRLNARLPKECRSELKIQYRMHPDIGSLVGAVFYPGTLESADIAGSSAVSLRSLDFPKNVMFVTTSRESDRGEKPASPGFTNECEVRVVKRVVGAILKSARKRHKEKLSLVVLTPYVASRDALERSIAELRSLFKNSIISVHTIHTFQGRQADIAVFSAVRSNSQCDLGFTKDARLVNVALSRGRGGLVIVGDGDFLSKPASSQAYRDVIGYIRSNPASCAFIEARHV
jgi:serine/threonine protein kinase